VKDDRFNTYCIIPSALAGGGLTSRFTLNMNNGLILNSKFTSMSVFQGYTANTLYLTDYLFIKNKIGELYV
jgi:hypothetical protein